MTILVLTMIIHIVLLFFQACNEGSNFHLDVDNQAFVVENGGVCGLGLYVEGDSVEDNFIVIDKQSHVGWARGEASILYINHLPSSCRIVRDDDTLRMQRLPLRPNTTYYIRRSGGCQRSCPICIRVDKNGKVYESAVPVFQ
ncbi:hypothetical protein [Prevotella histicola]|uniref:hypothetical protein n=1 Tax=Prevotella histicola TaxID=470565 RepID=UPI00361B554A